MTESLHIEVAEGGDTRLALVGELTCSTVPLFTVEVTETVGPARPRLLLDVARLQFCDSVGLSALIGAQRRAQLAGGSVVLFGVHGCLQRSLTVTGTDALFTLVGSAERTEGAVESATGRTGETA